MRPSSSDSGSRSARVVVVAAAAVAASAWLAACAPVDLGSVPFRCESGADAGAGALCPHGYACNSGLCVAQQIRSVPQRIAVTVDDNESAFSVHARTSDIVVCWDQDPSTRDPGIHAATLDAHGALATAPVGVDGRDHTNSQVLLGIYGDCMPAGDQQLVVASALLTQPRKFEFDLVAWDQAAPATTAPAFYSGLSNQSELPHFLAGTVGAEGWFIVPTWESDVQWTKVFQIIVVDPLGMTATSTRTNITKVSSDQHVVSTEVLAADGGAWLAEYILPHELSLVWVTHDLLSAPTSLSPVQHPSDYQAAYAIATHGTEVAVAYNVAPGAWKIWWIAPVNTPDGAQLGQSTVREGPAFNLDPGVVRPGGFYASAADQLVIAGATDSNHVTAWAVPWMGTATSTPQVVGTVSKLTSIVPRRISVTQLGTDLFAVWTERIPGNSTGLTEYTALFSSRMDPP